MLISPQQLLREFPDIRKCTAVIHAGGHEAEERLFYEEIGAKAVLWVEANQVLAEQLKAQFGIQKEGGTAHTVVHAAAWSREYANPLSLHVASTGPSSSLLPFATHADVYPDITYVGDQLVRATPIDEIVRRHQFYHLNTFLNLDIQGAEWEALVGAVTTLRDQVTYVYTEVNERELYRGCKRIEHIDMLLDSLGFTRKVTQMTGAGWGDAFYVRDNHGPQN